MVRNERAKTILVNMLKIYSNVSSTERHHQKSKMNKVHINTYTFMQWGQPIKEEETASGYIRL